MVMLRTCMVFTLINAGKHDADVDVDVDVKLRYYTFFQMFGGLLIKCFN